MVDQSRPDHRQPGRDERPGRPREAAGEPIRREHSRAHYERVHDLRDLVADRHRAEKPGWGLEECRERRWEEKARAADRERIALGEGLCELGVKKLVREDGRREVGERREHVGGGGYEEQRGQHDARLLGARASRRLEGVCVRLRPGFRIDLENGRRPRFHAGSIGIGGRPLNE